MSGTLYIVGGGTSHNEEKIYGSFVRACGGGNARIVLVVTASGDEPDGTFRSYQDDFEKLGVKRENVTMLPIYGTEFRDERGFNAMTGDHRCLPPIIEQATGIWFTGGDQFYTNQAFIRPDGSHTRALDMFYELYEKGGVLGGSSAGAAIMSSVMIAVGNNRGVLSHDTRFGYDNYKEIEAVDDPAEGLIIVQGLGFFKGGIVDQHFNTRPRLLRDIEACFVNKEGTRISFAVSEDTAMICKNDSITVLGGAGVYIIDCRKGERQGKGCYSGIVLHAIHEGDSYNLNTEEITLASESFVARERYISPDYISGGIIEGTAFDRLIEVNLLGAKSGCTYVSPQSGKEYVRGAVLYEAGGETYAVILDYFRADNTKGYMNTHMSFVNVGLNIVSMKIDIQA